MSRKVLILLLLLVILLLSIVGVVYALVYRYMSIDGSIRVGSK